MHRSSSLGLDVGLIIIVYVQVRVVPSPVLLVLPSFQLCRHVIL